MSGLPEKFPQQALDGVALNRITHFATDSQAETGGPVRPGQAIDDKMPRVNFPPVSPSQGKFPGMTNTQIGRKIKYAGVRQDWVLQGYLLGMVTTRFLRPLARRRLRTIRPFLLCIRFRKPWVRFLLTRLGW